MWRNSLGLGQQKVASPLIKRGTMCLICAVWNSSTECSCRTGASFSNTNILTPYVRSAAIESNSSIILRGTMTSLFMRKSLHRLLPISKGICNIPRAGSI
ncbi:hypothetical protein BDV38DRAFT_116969 [Aspergillus pseudotamarii]|uniref:Uncharacterized protein n=1 Tax=Aspergillus pseudotamarii TaxID=132259 RepID=A0A5N6SS55_ASPPS|nr:uncharacterized protein BDV38DRAFT_116969 [Aspergillus pseudotamarii]KAE8136213.1 hypothetical protein BDV38DRAFT_116969 [Aspergillus pseudotamarii]